MLIHAAAAAWIDHSASLVRPQAPIVEPIRVSLGIAVPAGGTALADGTAKAPGPRHLVAEDAPKLEPTVNATVMERHPDARKPADALGPPDTRARGTSPGDTAIAIKGTEPAAVVDMPNVPGVTTADSTDAAVGTAAEPTIRSVTTSIREMPLESYRFRIDSRANNPVAGVAETVGAMPSEANPIASAGASGAPDSHEARQGQQAEYARAVQSRLVDHRQYPRQAQLRRQQGIARLFFALDRDGRVVESRIEQSSGYRVLDAEALAMVDRAQPFPPLPSELGQSRLEMILPVQFRLR